MSVYAAQWPFVDSRIKAVIPIAGGFGGAEILLTGAWRWFTFFRWEKRSVCVCVYVVEC